MGVGYRRAEKCAAGLGVHETQYGGRLHPDGDCAVGLLNSQLSTILSRLSRFCALFAGLIGLLSLGEYAFDWNPGFDQWLFPEPAGTVGTSHPGRMASGQPVFQDFYRHELSQRVYLAALVPILDEADGHRPLGVLVLRIDPASYLYPFIRRWPVPSARGT